MVGVHLAILVTVVISDVEDFTASTVMGMVGIKLAILPTVLVVEASEAPFSWLSSFLMSKISKAPTVTGMVGMQLASVRVSEASRRRSRKRRRF